MPFATPFLDLMMPLYIVLAEIRHFDTPLRHYCTLLLLFSCLRRRFLLDYGAYFALCHCIYATLLPRARLR